MHGAGPAAAAGAVHVEEHDAIAFPQGRAVESGERAADGVEDAGRDVARDDRIRDAGELPLPQVPLGGGTVALGPVLVLQPQVRARVTGVCRTPP